MAQEIEMFPPKKDQPRKGKTPNKNFRCPPALLQKIEAAQAGGYSESDVIRQTLELAFEAKETMASDWWEMLKEARIKDEPAGVTLGRLALEGLKSRHKKR